MFEGGGAKSLDFTIKKWHFATHFSMWFPWVPLMRPVPKASFFQVELVSIGLKMPGNPEIGRKGCQRVFTFELPSLGGNRSGHAQIDA